MAPVVCVRLAVPVKLRLPAKLMALVIVRAEAASSEPPVTDKVLVPSAAALPIRKVPALKVVVPEYVLTPLRTNAPASALVSPAVPAMMELMVLVLPVATLIVGVVPASVNVLPVNVIPV